MAFSNSKKRYIIIVLNGPKNCTGLTTTKDIFSQDSDLKMSTVGCEIFFRKTVSNSSPIFFLLNL